MWPINFSCPVHLRSSRGFRHSEEVKRLSLLDPEQAKDVPRETLRRWRTQGKTRDRGREDRAAGLAWRWGIAGHRWNRHASISDDTRRRRVQRDRVRRLQHLNAAHPIADAPRVSGAPEAVLQFVQNRWAAHQLIMGLQSSSSFDLIVEAEDVFAVVGGGTQNALMVLRTNMALCQRCSWPSLVGNTFASPVAYASKWSVLSTGSCGLRTPSTHSGPPFPDSVAEETSCDDLSALAGRWLGMDEDPPMSWLALCPDRGRRGRAEDQRIHPAGVGAIPTSGIKSGDLSVAAKNLE